MEPTGGSFESHDHEFEEVRWISFDDAAGLLSFERNALSSVSPLRDSRRRPFDLRVPIAWPAGHLRPRSKTGGLPGWLSPHDGPMATPLADRHAALGARMWSSAAG